MNELSTYKLHFLYCTEEFVLKELLEKFQDIQIESKNTKEILSRSKEKDINVFRNLYSPI